MSGYTFGINRDYLFEICVNRHRIGNWIYVFHRNGNIAALSRDHTHTQTQFSIFLHLFGNWSFPFCENYSLCDLINFSPMRLSMKPHSSHSLLYENTKWYHVPVALYSLTECVQLVFLACTFRSENWIVSVLWFPISSYEFSTPSWPTMCWFYQCCCIAMP